MLNVLTKAAILIPITLLLASCVSSDYGTSDMSASSIEEKIAKTNKTALERIRENQPEVSIAPPPQQPVLNGALCVPSPPWPSLVEAPPQIVNSE